jgi:hypothetical protein
MKRFGAIQIKAAFLLAVFSLSMMVGFACAVHLTTLLFGHHHKEVKTVGQNSHGKEEAKPHEKGPCKDNCCNEHVVKIAQADKTVPHFFTGLNVIFFTALISSTYNIQILKSFGAELPVKYFVRGHHPPIPDIRIAIQSFQI